jgi:hypothetical protein
MSYELQMHTKIHDWLTGLRGTEPEVARLVGEAVLAMLEAGASLGPPLVVPLETALLPPADPREALDYSYQRQLEEISDLTATFPDGSGSADDDAVVAPPGLMELRPGAPGSMPAGLLGTEVEIGAAALIARHRARTLAQARQLTGLTQAQVAGRMRVRQERVSAIERADPGATEIRTLAAYVARNSYSYGEPQSSAVASIEFSP